MAWIGSIVRASKEHLQQSTIMMDPACRLPRAQEPITPLPYPTALLFPLCIYNAAVHRDPPQTRRISMIDTSRAFMSRMRNVTVHTAITLLTAFGANPATADD